MIDNYTDIKEGVPLWGIVWLLLGTIAVMWKVACITGENTGGMRFEDNLPFMGYGFPGSRVFQPEI
ncbi:MAG: hypothetical protein ACLVAW_02900 [Eisenbergiella massiliensis]